VTHDLCLHTARVADADAVASLSRELGYEQSAADAARRLEALSADGDHLVLVVEAQDGRVAGWIHAHYCIELAMEPFVEIMALIVTAECRGRGLGGLLAEGVAEWARGKGVDEVCVRARVERFRAPAFYERHGFALDKKQNVFVRKLSAGDGRPEA
jgi:GNAT superfamily N-acetyltransferase